MQILEKRYGQKNGVIRSQRQELMNGKAVSDSIADFEVLANELKCFHSVLLHYSVNLVYFSGELVQDIVARRASNRMCWLLRADGAALMLQISNYGLNNR